MANSKKTWESAREYFSKLSSRERTIVLVGIVALFFFIIFMVLSLVPRGGAKKKNKLAQLTDQSAQFAKAGQEYAQLKPVVDLVDSRLAQRPTDFDLYRKVNEITGQTGIRPLVLKMDPGQMEGKEFLDEEFVDLNIQKIDLRMLINFLEQVEQLPGMVRIKQLTIKTRMDNTKTLDVVLRISSFKEKAP